MSEILVFHPTIAPYRIDLFNDLYKYYNAKICLYYRNLKDQTFKNYNDITKKLNFVPEYLEKSVKVGKREIQCEIIKKIKEYNPDIILVNEYNESFWAAYLYRMFSLKKYRIISISDDSEDMVINDHSMHSQARKIALRNIDGVILCNIKAQKCYAKLFPGVKTCVMPIIQDEKKYFGDKEWVQTRAHEIIDNEKLLGKRVFIFVGRMSPEKNIKYLIDSFIKQHTANPENVLLLVGDCIEENRPYYENLTSLVSQSEAEEYVRFAGRKESDELKAWMFSSQILVLPSYREPFGAVVNEALICGNYVMVSNVAGSACLVNEENGRLLDITEKYIDFAEMSNIVPTLSFDYIDNKTNKMDQSYKDRLSILFKWLNEFAK